MFGDVDTCQSTQTGAVETETYSFVSWLNRGAVPLTVTSDVSATVYRIYLRAYHCYCHHRTWASIVSTTVVSNTIEDVP